MRARIFVGNRRVDGVPADDRGLAYGDGLFETMRVHRGDIHWWDAHWARLESGASRLRLALPRQQQVRDEAATLFDDAADGVLRLQLTRGSGGRGYAPADNPVPTWMLSRHPLPQPQLETITAIWCETRLAVQPLLAGLKHCNRLEQVLARLECSRAGANEGLMCDGQGSVVSATSANLFVHRDGRWQTPLLDRCGVAGICRAQLLPVLEASEVRLDPAAVDSADAVFLCNAVRGILPLARLDASSWKPHAEVDAARLALARLHPAFASEIAPDMELS